MMKNLSDNFYSKMFFLGALWNIAIGLAGVLFYEFTITLFFGPDAVAYNLISAMFYRLFMVAVIVFGVGYFMVSRDLSQNRAILWLGLACKMILFVVFTSLFFSGKATLLAFITLTGDFIWSLMFFYFIWQTRERVQKNIFIG
jgi:hypothetical protein